MDTQPKKPLKGSGRLFFTSDTHFGHGNIIKYSKRPFLGPLDKEELERIGGSWHNGDWKGRNSSQWRMSKEAIELMDNSILDEINNIVGENDILWHLGDFAMPGREHNYRYRCQYYRDRIKCKTVNIVWGNHDDRKIRDLFNESYDLKSINSPTGSHKIIMCHYAMAVWDGSHRGNVHLYGHSHSEAEPWLERTMIGRKSVDVGVDNAAKLLGAYRPWTMEEIDKHMASRGGFAFDHHVGKMANTPREEELN